MRQLDSHKTCELSASLFDSAGDPFWQVAGTFNNNPK